jgi:mannose-6-phosphate isomerase-like protein (cupin superfamily)
VVRPSGDARLRLGDGEFDATAGSALFARRGTPHTYRNVGDVEAQYLLVMPPRIAALIEAIHHPEAHVPALFEAHASKILR